MDTTLTWGQYLADYRDEKNLYLFTKPKGLNLLDTNYVRDYTKNKDSEKHFVARRYVEPDQIIDRLIQILKSSYEFYKKTKKLHLDQKTENYVIDKDLVLSLIDLDDSKTEDQLREKNKQVNHERENRRLRNEKEKREKEREKERENPVIIPEINQIKQKKEKKKKIQKKISVRKNIAEPIFTYYGSPGYTLLEGIYGKKNEILAIGMTITEQLSLLLGQALLRAELKHKEYINDFTCDEYQKMHADIFIDPFLMDEFKRDGIENTWDTKPAQEIFNKYLAKRLKHIWPEDFNKLREDEGQITNLCVALCYINPRIIKEIIEPCCDKNPDKRLKCFDNIPEYISILEKCKKDYYTLCTVDGRFKQKSKFRKSGDYSRMELVNEHKDIISNVKLSLH